MPFSSTHTTPSSYEPREYMETKELEAIKKTVQEAVEKLHAPLSAIALLQLADEFYTKEERAAHYTHYAQLIELDAQAYSNLQEARPKDELSYEQRVKAFGKMEADAQLAEFNRLFEIKSMTSKKISDFQQEHRLIIRLLEAKTTLGKSRYES